MKKLILFVVIIVVLASCQSQNPQQNPQPTSPPTANSMNGTWILKKKGMIYHNNGQPNPGTMSPTAETYNFSGDGKVYLVGAGPVQGVPSVMGTHNGSNTYRQNGFAHSDSFAVTSLSSQTMVLEQLGILKPESNYSGGVWKFVYERP